MTVSPPRVLLVAGPGWGKTFHLETRAPAGGLLLTAAEALEADLTAARWLGIDDLDELGTPDQVRLVRRLMAVPSEIGVVLTSRMPVDPAVRLRMRGAAVHERGPQDLALDVHGVAQLLTEQHGVVEPAVAVELHRRTTGWPALVQLLADEVARPDGRSRPRTAGPAHGWLRDHVLPALPGAALELVSGLALCGPVSPAALDTLSDAVAGPGTVDALIRLGALVRQPLVGGHEQVVVVPLIAEAAGDHRPDAAWLRAAATVFERCGEPLPAALGAARAGDHAGATRLIAEHGSELLRRGGARDVVAVGQDLVRWLSDPPDELRLIVADGLRMTGDPVAALDAFEPLVTRADREGWSAALAWRRSMVHYMLGDHEAALEQLDRVTAPEGRTPDVVEWHACRAQTLATLGRSEEATRDATAALRAAEQDGDAWALPAAHLAVARCSHGSRKEAHLERAATAAAAVGDVVSAARAATNRTYLLLVAARYAEAAPVAREAVRLTELVSPPGIQVSALHNLAEALTAVGEHDEAAWHLRRSLSLSRGLGPGRSATGLLGLGRVQRSRGRSEQAKAAYLEAADLARSTGERQLLVQALAGLARVSASSEPGLAAAWAQEACELAPAGQLSEALAARALVAAAMGEPAVTSAREAVAAARTVQMAARLAEALELLGTVTDDRREALAALTEAAGIWRDGGAAPSAARVDVLLGRLPDADPAARSRSREAARTLTRLGVQEVNGVPLDRASARHLSIEVLGRFCVTVDGVPVPHAAWRSRQARTLVKLLAARRGRAVTRSAVCGLLWPDDDREKTGHRLSVLLATVRGVLDPAKTWPTDHYVVSDAAGLWLDLRHVSVDADDVIADTSHALALLSAGDLTVATEILADVDRRYRGDAFEDEPDEEWADALREEARSAWLRAVRRLLALRRPDAGPADSHRLLVRLLAADPYDERAHRALVTSLVRNGRHGEARRAFHRWTAAMRSIDAPPPDPSVLLSRRTVGARQHARAALVT